MKGRNMQTQIIENQEVVMVFSMQQLGNCRLAELEAMDFQHSPTDSEREWLELFAKQATPPHYPAPPERLTKTILALSAALPKQATDEMRGETMLAVYQRMLGDLTVEELEASAHRCLTELDWFPTIKQVRDRAGGGYGRMRTKEQILHQKIKALVAPRVEIQKPTYLDLTDDERAEISNGLAALTRKAPC